MESSYYTKRRMEIRRKMEKINKNTSEEELISIIRRRHEDWSVVQKAIEEALGRKDLSNETLMIIIAIEKFPDNKQLQKLKEKATRKRKEMLLTIEDTDLILRNVFSVKIRAATINKCLIDNPVIPNDVLKSWLSMISNFESIEKISRALLRQKPDAKQLTAILLNCKNEKILKITVRRYCRKKTDLEDDCDLVKLLSVPFAEIIFKEKIKPIIRQLPEEELEEITKHTESLRIGQRVEKELERRLGRKNEIQSLSVPPVGENSSQAMAKVKEPNL